MKPCPYCGALKLIGFMATCGEKLCIDKHKAVRHQKTLEKNKKNCLHCGEIFYSRRDHSKYCSHECFYGSGGAIRAGRRAVEMKRKYGNKKDANHNDIVDAFIKMGAIVKDLSDVGNGVPDLIVGIKGEWYLVDVKNPETSYGRKGLNKRQTEWAFNWQGGGVYLIYTIDDVKALIEQRYDDVKCIGGFNGVRC